MRMQRIRQLISETSTIYAFRCETRPQSDHDSGFLKDATQGGRGLFLF